MSIGIGLYPISLREAAKDATLLFMSSVVNMVGGAAAATGSPEQQAAVYSTASKADIIMKLPVMDIFFASAGSPRATPGI